MSIDPTLNSLLRDMQPVERLRWAHERHGDGPVLLTSFGAQSAVMLDLMHQVNPDIKVLHVDTGENNQIKLKYMSRLRDSLGLKLKFMQAANEDEKGIITKQALRELNATAIMRGIRAVQTSERASKDYVEFNRKLGIERIYPILDKSDEWVEGYLAAIPDLQREGYKPGLRTHGGNDLAAGAVKKECPLNYQI